MEFYINSRLPKGYYYRIVSKGECFDDIIDFRFLVWSREKYSDTLRRENVVDEIDQHSKFLQILNDQGSMVACFRITEIMDYNEISKILRIDYPKEDMRFPALYLSRLVIDPDHSRGLMIYSSCVLATKVIWELNYMNSYCVMSPKAERMMVNRLGWLKIGQCDSHLKRLDETKISILYCFYRMK